MAKRLGAFPKQSSDFARSTYVVCDTTNIKAWALRICILFAALACSFAHAQSVGDSYSGDGKLQSSIVENVDAAAERIHYHLAVGGFDFVPLFISELPKGVQVGAQVHVEGTWQFFSDRGFAVVPQRITVLAQAQDISISALGARKALAVRVQFNDDTVACSENQIAGYVWDGALNVRQFYETATYNQVTFTPDVDGNSQPDVFTVSINYAASVCAYSSWMSAARTALQGLGVNLALYQHIIYVFPNSVNSSCGFAGLAPLGCGSSCWIITNFCDYPDVMVHELGHNFGMQHAAIDADNNGVVDAGALSAYGDYSCPMGISGVGWRHFNAPHQIQLGWIPPERVTHLSVSGDYDIAAADIDPLTASPAPPTQIQALTFPVPDSSGQTYYFSYRQSDATYSQDLFTTYDAKTNIHRFSGSNYTYLVKAIGNGETADLGNGIQITQLASHQNWTHVHVALSGAVTTPTPTQTPTPGATPQATPSDSTPVPTPTVGSKYLFQGTIQVPHPSASLFRKLRVVMDGPTSKQRHYLAVSSSGTFSAQLSPGKYRFEAQRKPGARLPPGLKFSWHSLTVPARLSLVLNLRKR